MMSTHTNASWHDCDLAAHSLTLHNSRTVVPRSHERDHPRAITASYRFMHAVNRRVWLIRVHARSETSADSWPPPVGFDRAVSGGRAFGAPSSGPCESQGDSGRLTARN
ncbi:hypothetical protein MRX96_036783 [Rhipicephalus microplus]